MTDLNVEYIDAHVSQPDARVLIVCPTSVMAIDVCNLFDISRTSMVVRYFNKSEIRVVIIKEEYDIIKLSGLQLTHMSVCGKFSGTALSKLASRVRSATYKGEMIMKFFNEVPNGSP